MLWNHLHFVIFFNEFHKFHSTQKKIYIEYLKSFWHKIMDNLIWKKRNSQKSDVSETLFHWYISSCKKFAINIYHSILLRSSTVYSTEKRIKQYVRQVCYHVVCSKRQKYIYIYAALCLTISFEWNDLINSNEKKNVNEKSPLLDTVWSVKECVHVLIEFHPLRLVNWFYTNGLCFNETQLWTEMNNYFRVLHEKKRVNYFVGEKSDANKKKRTGAKIPEVCLFIVDSFDHIKNVYRQHKSIDVAIRINVCLIVLYDIDFTLVILRIIFYSPTKVCSHVFLAFC